MFGTVLPYYQITIHKENDASFHIKTYVYRIKTGAGNYILQLEEYIRNTFVIKYFPLRLKRDANRYQVITNDNVMQGVIGTALRIFILYLQERPDASLGFIATATILPGFQEEKENNQRFRIYKQIMQNFFGHETFSHFIDKANSAYLMANTSNNNMVEYVAEMQQRFSDMYPKMFDLAFVAI